MSYELWVVGRCGVEWRGVELELELELEAELEAEAEVEWTGVRW